MENAVRPVRRLRRLIVQDVVSFLPVGGAGETECDVYTTGSSATQHDPRHDGHSSMWRDVALVLGE